MLERTPPHEGPRHDPRRHQFVLGDDGLARPRGPPSTRCCASTTTPNGACPSATSRACTNASASRAFQAGLSWATILRKRPAFRAAFHDFQPDTVAAFTEADVERLMQDAGIVRNRLKIRAAITNAKATIALRDDGGLVDFVWQFQPDSHAWPTAHDDDPHHLGRSPSRCPRRCGRRASRSSGPPPCSP